MKQFNSITECGQHSSFLSKNTVAFFTILLKTITVQFVHIFMWFTSSVFQCVFYITYFQWIFFFCQCGLPNDNSRNLDLVKETFLTEKKVKSMENRMVLLSPDQAYSRVVGLRTKAANGQIYTVLFLLSGVFKQKNMTQFMIHVPFYCSYSSTFFKSLSISCCQNLDTFIKWCC